MDVTSEEAELSHDVLSALAHELGGIASALDLRASAMTRSIPEQDLNALKDIAEEVRQVTRAARFARGSDGFGMLNPSRRQSLHDWWKLAHRFTSTVLPRGVAVEVSFGDAELTESQSSALTWIWLAACKDIAERGIRTPCKVSLRGESTPNGITLTAQVDGDQRLTGERGQSRWARYASRAASAIKAGDPDWVMENQVVRWRCAIPVTSKAV
jgi:hypothetical protein